MFAAAQNLTLMVEGTTPSLYLTHTVAAKENFYSIGRLYNVSPKEIAPLNKLKLEKGLNPGQVIKIPLNKSNFSQSGTKAGDEVLVPLYHTVKEKEGLYRIGVNHNKLPVVTLKKWNKIKSDEVSIGANLIVGYLKVKKKQSAFAAQTVVVTPPETKPVQPEQPPVKIEEKPIVPPEEKKEPVKDEKVVQPVVKPVTNFGTDFNGGIFKNLYESQANGNEVIKEEGMAGVFKSTSGWKDGKYYCLHNVAAAGTVIKITNNTTGKSIYAKVLDAMPDIKHNNGLLILLSSAAADELGAGENNFNCILNYSK